MQPPFFGSMSGRLTQVYKDSCAAGITPTVMSLGVCCSSHMHKQLIFGHGFIFRPRRPLLAASSLLIKSTADRGLAQMFCDSDCIEALAVQYNQRPGVLRCLLTHTLHDDSDLGIKLNY